MKPSTKNILITGIAGFIGFHLAKELINEDLNIIGLDNLNSYYDVELKKNRIKFLQKEAKEKNKSITLFTGDLNDIEILEKIFNDFSPNVVIHLAAQAGVRYSISNPSQYINSNLVGFGNILEKCRQHKTTNFIYASSSSVYGGNTKIPFSENDSVNHPVSLYAATKRSNELMAHTYSHLFGIPTTGLRFFTVYGPWGRPDMAPMIFTNAIFKNQPINIFNKGQMSRDFTYIDDVVETIARLLNKPASKNYKFNKDLPEVRSSWAPYKIFNIGNSNPVNLMEFLETLENQIGKKAIKIFEEMKQGDVKDTYADNKFIKTWTGFAPKTNLKKGIKKFINWYKDYYKIN